MSDTNSPSGCGAESCDGREWRLSERDRLSVAHADATAARDAVTAANADVQLCAICKDPLVLEPGIPPAMQPQMLLCGHRYHAQCIVQAMAT